MKPRNGCEVMLESNPDDTAGDDDRFQKTGPLDVAADDRERNTGVDWQGKRNVRIRQFGLIIARRGGTMPAHE